MGSVPIIILYLDAEPGFTKLVSTFFEKKSEFRIIPFHSAREALIALNTGHYDVIVSDCLVPDMDGITFLKVVRERFREIPFIIFTGYSSEQVAIDAINYGADFYLKKETDLHPRFSELAEKIRQALQRRRGGTIMSGRIHPDQIFASVNVGFVIIDVESHVIIDINPAGASLIGLPIEAITGKTCHNFICPLEAGKCHIADLHNTSDNSEYILINRNGARIPIIKYATQIEMNGRECIIEAFIDNRGRRKVEESLRISEEKFSTVFMRNPVAMTLVSLTDGTFTDVNDAFLRRTGYSRGDVVGSTAELLGFFPDDDEYDMFVSELREKHHVRGMDLRCLVKNGEIRTCRFSSGIVLIDGRPQVLSIVEDITERRLVEDEIKESADRYRLILQNAQEGIMVNELTERGPGRFLEVNESACRILGMSWEELKGIRLTDLDTPDIKKKAPEMVREIIRTNYLNFQTTYLDPGLKEKILEVSVSLFSIQGRSTMLSVIRDITEQKAAKSAIRALISGLVGTTGRDCLVRITESISAWLNAECVIIGEISPDHEDVRALSMILDGTRIQDFSYRLKGTPCEKTATEGFCVFSDDVASYFPESKETAELQIRGYAGRSLLDPEGSVVGILCILSRNPLILPPSAKEILDIIAAKASAEIGRLKALKALSASEEMLTLVMNGVPTLLAYLDPDMKFIYLNRSHTDWYGCTGEEMVGKSLLDILPDDLSDCAVLPYHQVLSGNEAVFEGTVRDITGASHVLSFCLVPHTRKGEVIGIFASINDVTDQKRAEAALQQANKKLNLLSRISRHDIGNQLMILGTLFDLVHMKSTDPGSAVYFSHIGEVIEKIMQMIRFTGNYEQIGIHSPIWQSIRSLVKKAADNSSLTDLRLIIDIPEQAEIFTDPLVIKVFYNLIDNTLRHGGDVSTIRFSLETRDRDLMIICTDDGTGIPHHEKEQIFEREFGRNTGLGLYLSREILDITGISIRENGNPGEGSRFEIIVPEDNYRIINRS